MKKKEKYNLDIIKFSMFLRAGKVESGPPLSTILGNFGVNTVNFCKEFNEFTKILPNYFLVEVIIIINNDKTYKFFIKEPSVSFLLKLVSFKYEILDKGSGGYKIKNIKVIRLKDIYLISFFKFNNFKFTNLKIICGIVVSSRYFIV